MIHIILYFKVLVFLCLKKMKMEISCSDCKNANCFVKGSLSEDRLSKHKTVSKLIAGQFIFKEQNPFDGIYIILSGKVKVFSTGYKKRVQILRLAKDGFVLGHRGVGKKYYTISAVTLENTHVCFIDNDIFYEALKSDNELVYRLMFFYAEELRNAENRMKTLAQMTVREKVIEALLLTARIFGVSCVNEQTILIDAQFSRSDYAELAGIRTEQFIRELSELKREQAVEVTPMQKIRILNATFLNNQISEYYVENFDLSFS